MDKYCGIASCDDVTVKNYGAQTDAYIDRIVAMETATVVAMVIFQLCKLDMGPCALEQDLQNPFTPKVLHL